MPIALIVLSLLVAWNVKIRVPARPAIHPKLAAYVETFKRYCNIYKADCSKLSKFKVDIVDMTNYKPLYKLLGIKGYVIGHCWRASNEIEINADYFKESNPAEIEQVVIHELGHCILDLEHIEEEKLAIMNPYSLYYEYYLRDYNQLMNDFFGCKSSCPEIKYNDATYKRN